MRHSSAGSGFEEGGPSLDDIEHAPSSAMHGVEHDVDLATISSLVVWPSTKTPIFVEGGAISWRRVQVVVIMNTHVILRGLRCRHQKVAA